MLHVVHFAQFRSVFPTIEESDHPKLHNAFMVYLFIFTVSPNTPLPLGSFCHDYPALFLDFSLHMKWSVMHLLKNFVAQKSSRISPEATTANIRGLTPLIFSKLFLN